MRHGNGLRKLNRTSAHRKAMFQNMMNSLIAHEAIKTTVPKATELRSIIEPMITRQVHDDPVAQSSDIAPARAVRDREHNSVSVGPRDGVRIAVDEHASAAPRDRLPNLRA